MQFAISRRMFASSSRRNGLAMLPVTGRLGQSEEHDLFTGYRTDVVV